MEKLIAIVLPDGQRIEAPPGIPTNISVGALASFGLSLATVIGIILALFYLLYGGLYWIQSKGDKEKLDKARRIILYSIFGLIVMSLALVVVNVIATAFGVETPLSGS